MRFESDNHGLMLSDCQCCVEQCPTYGHRSALTLDSCVLRAADVNRAAPVCTLLRRRRQSQLTELSQATVAAENLSELCVSLSILRGTDKPPTTKPLVQQNSVQSKSPSFYCECRERQRQINSS